MDYYRSGSRVFGSCTIDLIETHRQEGEVDGKRRKIVEKDG